MNAAAKTATLYLADPQTGVLAVIGSPGQIAFVDASSKPLDLPPGGYGIDFNSTVDRFSATTKSGLNFRINPNTGAPVEGDLGGAAGSVTGINPDGAINGLPLGSTGISATAYTNSYGEAPNSGVTTEYTLMR